MKLLSKQLLENEFTPESIWVKIGAALKSKDLPTAYSLSTDLSTLLRRLQDGDPDTLDERIARAIRDLKRESGFSDVRISDLQRRSGVKLEELKSWIIKQSRAGKVLPTRGDWSLADAEARGAAVEIGGEQHLRVRLL
jgi:hypothetical protein